MRRFVFLVLVLLGTIPAFSLRLTPLPEATLYPASAGALDRQGLVDLSLALSGVSSPAIPAYRAVLDRWSQDFLATDAATQAPAKRAEGLLLFLHSRLKGYSLTQTRIDVLVDKGTFNCVSSALVYMILGRDAGLDVQAVATSDHAFALVRVDGRDVDVETTTAHGFDPGTKTEFTNSFGQTGFVYVPPGNYNKRRTITDRQLLGLLVQNRMADYQRVGQPEESVGPAIDRWTIEGTPEAFTTLTAGFTNYGAWLNARREYSKGLDLVDKMVAVTGPVPEAKALAWAFLNNAVNGLLDRQDWAGAQALTVAWRNRDFLTEAQAAQTLALVADRQLTLAVKTLPPNQGAEKVDQAFAQGLIDAPRRQELLSYLYGQEVQKMAASQGARAAWSFLGTLPAEVRAFPALEKARSVYAYNWSVEVHNQFARTWNAGQKAEARKLLLDALNQLPDSDLLKRDLVLSQGN
jgi:hypothetical protein